MAALHECSAAIAQFQGHDQELAALLIRRSEAHFEHANFRASRADALAAYYMNPSDPTAIFRACEACVQLGRQSEACSILSAGAALHRDGLFDFFSKRARSLGSWRLPPPLQGLSDEPPEQAVARLTRPTREQFAQFVERHVPVIVTGFAPPAALAEWSWGGLISMARDALANSGSGGIGGEGDDGVTLAGDVTISGRRCRD